MSRHPRYELTDLQDERVGESSADIRNRINYCRKIQAIRYEKHQVSSNANMTNKMLSKYCQIGKKEASILKRAMNELSLSARAYDKILKVSRTIADLDKSDNIEMNHLLESIQYRSLDRSLIL